MLLKKIIRKNQGTEYGRLHHFDQIRSVEDFRAQVPLSTYEDFAPYIERAKNNEPNLLTKAKIIGYSRTSGSSGVPKFIPSTSDSLNAYLKYTWTRALALASNDLKAQGKRYRAGRGLYALPSVEDRLPNGLLCSNIAEVGAERLGFIYHYILALPGNKLFNIHQGDFRYCIYRFALEDEDVSFVFAVFQTMLVAQMNYLKNNWQVLVHDIETGTIDESIELAPSQRAELLKKVRPMPERARYLREQFERGFDSTILKRLWPNMSFVSGIGTASFQRASERMKGYSEGVAMDYSVYAASEGLVAACYKLDCIDMQLLTDSCFFEFIPEESGQEADIVTLDELELGKRYEVVITTQSGLYRYRLKDIVEVVGYRNRCPLIHFLYRRGQLLNLAGEKFSQEDARATIAQFEQRCGIEIPHWIFYEDDSVSPSRYAVLVECEDELPENCAQEIEQIVGACNHRYVFQKQKRDIGDLVVQRQQPGTHEAWRQLCASKGAFVGQVKPVHTLDNEEKREFFLSRIAE